jgi:diguanylate cyclase (GGDEF)-like protein/PAS domain S-box-containing protein
MGISQGFAVARGDGREVSANLPELVCSYDLDGNIIDLSGAVERILGYSRDQALTMHLSALVDRESWELTQEKLARLEAAPQNLEITVRARQGEMRLAITRRLLFEGGRPIAVQDAGRVVALPGSFSEHTGAFQVEERLSTKSRQLVHFARQLKQLHLLSTTTYDSLEQAFEDHLRTGCQLLGLPIGMILQTDGDIAMIRAARGSADLRAGIRLPLHATPCRTVADRLKTRTCCGRTEAQELRPEFEIYIGTPVLVGSELFGILGFCSPLTGAARNFAPSESEVIGLLAQSVAKCVLEHRIHTDHRKTSHLEKSRNQVLEMVAANQKLETTLNRIVHMAETQRSDLLCSVLLLNDGFLFWAVAPSFPPETIRHSKPVRVTADNSDLVVTGLARSPLFWDDPRCCPLWAERSYFASQIGIIACASIPIASATGVLFGVLALHYRHAPANNDGDRDLLQQAARLAALAIEQRKFTERLEFQARHDSLTGLPNRAYFMELLDNALAVARQRSGVMAVLFIDLDRFKQINDTLGHAMGDRLLKEVGGRLRRLLTEDDLAGRMGGDEFTIVMTRQPDEQTAIQASEEFLKALRAPHRMEGTELFVTASIGVAMFPRHGTTAQELLRNADLAMYRAKNGGKNDLELFLAEHHVSGLERLQLENALRRALENHEFELLYQPVVNMNGKVEGLEALLTWRHPIHGTISPRQFIPIAEETGLIIEIGSWVIRQACVQGVRWQKAGYSSARISVNVSALQFERREFVQTVATTLALTGFPPQCLELELTESYVMRDLSESVRRMTQIRNLGVSISIDDFGTGYSSLSYLNKLPVDSLKIDQSFLRGLQEPEGSLPVVQSIVRLAHSMSLTVVAEGVETAAELDLVRVIGCDKVQGHVYGPSLRHDEAEALLAKNARLTPLAR